MSYRKTGKITYVSDDRMEIFIDTGQLGKMILESPCDFSPGTIVAIDDDDIISLVPEEALPSPHRRVGVVQLVLDDITVIDTGISWELFPTTSPSPPYNAGNTVEYNEGGVKRKLSDTSIRQLQSPDDELAARFRSYPTGLKYEAIGGLGRAIHRARELIEIPLQHPERLSRIGARSPRGILLIGPPGTGKTLLARTIASNTDAQFYAINGPEIISKWLGESERVLRAIFSDAKSKPKSILFFDEIDSIAGRRSPESHEATNRVVAQLLTLMDGVDPKAGHIVILAATNRPRELDPALMRPGRFDAEIEFSLPTLGERLDILQKGAAGVRTDNIQLSEIAEQTEGCTGADLAAIWTESALLAAADNRDSIRDEDLIGGTARVLSRISSRGTHASDFQAPS